MAAGLIELIGLANWLATGLGYYSTSYWLGYSTGILRLAWILNRLAWLIGLATRLWLLRYSVGLIDRATRLWLAAGLLDSDYSAWTT